MSFRLGGLTSFLGGIILLFGAGVWLWRTFYDDSGTELTNTISIAKNSVIPMALNLFNRGIDFVFALYYLRIFGPGDAGRYFTAITIASMYEIIANWGLNTLVIREVSADRSRASRYLLNTTILRIGLGFVATLPVFIYLGGRALAGNPLDGDTQLAIFLIMIGMMFSGVSAGLTGLFYAFEEAEMPAFVTTITTIMKVGFGVIVLLMGFGFLGLAAVSILVNIITVGILLVVTRRRIPLPGPWQLDWSMQRDMVRLSYPLMLNHLLATVFFQLDVPMLQQIRGDEEVGWYNTAYKYVNAFNVIPSFLTFALFPVLSRQVHSDLNAARRTFRMSVKLLWLIALPLAAITMLASPWLIGILGGENFLPHGAIALRIMIWSIPFGWINSVTNYTLFALGQERMQPRAFLVGVAFNFITNLIFIPMFGYAAAATTTILSEVVLLAVFHYYLIQKMPNVGWIDLLWKLLVALALMLGGLWLGGQVGLFAGLALGLIIYLVSLFGLRVFGDEERRILATIMPASVASRFGLVNE